MQKQLRHLLKGVVVMVVFLVTVQASHAAIININSLTNNESNPVSLYFDAGTYEVTPIGVAEGGAYTAWSAWYAWFPNPLGCDQDGAYCTYGWLNYYHVESAEFGELFPYTQVVAYETQMLALENAASVIFTLTTGAYVDFYIRDGVNGNLASDNFGGMSLSVDLFNVSAPSVFVLMSLGLMMLLVTVNRNQHSQSNNHYL